MKTKKQIQERKIILLKKLNKINENIIETQNKMLKEAGFWNNLKSKFAGNQQAQTSQQQNPQEQKSNKWYRDQFPQLLQFLGSFGTFKRENDKLFNKRISNEQLKYMRNAGMQVLELWENLQEILIKNIKDEEGIRVIQDISRMLNAIEYATRPIESNLLFNHINIEDVENRLTNLLNKYKIT